MSTTGANGRRFGVARKATLRRPPLAVPGGAPHMLSPVPDGLARTGEYSIFGSGPPGEKAAFRERRVSFALIIFAIATVVAVLYSLERYFYRKLLGQPVSLGQLVPSELVFTYIWALLTPLVLWMGRRFPVWGAHLAHDASVALR